MQEPSQTDSRRCAAPRTGPAGPGGNGGCGPSSPCGQTAERSKRQNPERPRTPARKPPHPLPCLTCPSLPQLPRYPIMVTVVVILAHVWALPASAPAVVKSMTRPVYPPWRRAASGSTPPVPLAVPRGSADGRQTPARGRGPKPQSSGRGIITLRKERCCLQSSKAGRQGPFCPPGYVQQSEDRCVNRNLALGLGPAWLGNRWAADVAENLSQR